MSQLGLGAAFEEAPTTERVTNPRAPGRRSCLAVAIAVIVVLALIVGVAVFVRNIISSQSQNFTGSGSGEVTVTVAKGDALRTIGTKLASAGVTSSSAAFTDAAAAEPKSSQIGPGSYQLRLGMSGEAAVALMLSPESRAGSRLAVPEGWRSTQTLAAAAKATGLSEQELSASLGRAGSLGLPVYAEGNPEGFLFPATYDLTAGLTPDQLWSAMFSRFDKSAMQLDLDARAKELRLTPLQVVTVASLLEGEVAPADFPKVARVIYNRMKAGMRLQFDSTVNFALGTQDIKLTKAQLAVDSPYNTYRVKGLPPGPIGSPGDAALEAALSPADGSWLYFVSTDPKAKTTEFATTYAEFLALKRKYQSNVG